jgi:hypothetical protein
VKRLAALVCIVLSLTAAGCGFGEGEERGGSPAEMRVTRDFGHKLLGSARIDSVHEDETVMRMLRSDFDIDTRYGGRFVQSIDGLAGTGAGGNRDWFYWVNGVEGSVGAGEFELSPGDRVQWDWRDWGATMRVPAIVGAYPEPFVHGLEGKRRPVRVECESGELEARRGRPHHPPGGRGGHRAGHAPARGRARLARNGAGRRGRRRRGAGA